MNTGASTHKISVIIVAGGTGSRMGKDIPKQFLEMAGKPVIARTVEAFIQALPEAAIYIAVHNQWIDHMTKICFDYGFGQKVTICEGGHTRFHSVKNTLREVAPCEVVLVHDAARPLVSEAIILSVVAQALEKGSSVPVMPPVDSFRVISPGGNSSVINRSLLRTVQTPQGFRYSILVEAYSADYSAVFTDDASVVENCGFPIHLCDGDSVNIKITTPYDLCIAECLHKVVK